MMTKIVPYAGEAARHLREADSRMASVIDRVGPCVLRVHACSPYESLVRAIVFQQLSGKAAETIFGRVVTAAGGRVEPESIGAVGDAALRAAGLSFRKIRYIRDLSARTIDGSLALKNIKKLPDESVVEQLVAVKGIGVWSAQMFLMFAMGRPDVLPVGDLGVQKAAMKLYQLRKMPDAKKLTTIANCWKPYRTVACWYLWRSLDADGKIGD